MIVTEFVDGRGFEELKQLPQDERDRIGEIIFRFYFGCMYRHRQFSGDPHPGNFLLMDDGRVAFLDFGLFKRIPPRSLEHRAATASAPGIEGDGEELQADLDRDGLPRSTPSASARTSCSPSSATLTWWYTLDEEVELDARDRDAGDDRHVRPALASTSARCATRRCPPTTSSAGAWRC